MTEQMSELNAQAAAAFVFVVIIIAYVCEIISIIKYANTYEIIPLANYIHI